MISWVVLLAQWSDLGTFLLASRIYPGGEGNPLMALLPAEWLIGVKVGGMLLMLATASGLTGRKRRWGLGFAVFMGLLGSATNVIFGLL